MQVNYTGRIGGRITYCLANRGVYFVFSCRVFFQDREFYSTIT